MRRWAALTLVPTAHEVQHTHSAPTASPSTHAHAYATPMPMPTPSPTLLGGAHLCTRPRVAREHDPPPARPLQRDAVGEGDVLHLERLQLVQPQLLHDLAVGLR